MNQIQACACRPFGYSQLNVVVCEDGRFPSQDGAGSDFGRRSRSDSEGAIAMRIAKFRIALNSVDEAIQDARVWGDRLTPQAADANKDGSDV
jgi:hypothetical protein